MASTVEQKKNQKEGEEKSGTSPNNIKKPDFYGFGSSFLANTLQLLFYVALIGSIGTYTAKTAVANNSSDCIAELVDTLKGTLLGCRRDTGIGPAPPFLDASKTSVVAKYFRQVFTDAFSTNTSFITTYSNVLNSLPNWAILLAYSIVSIPLFLVLWIFNWITNIIFALTNLKLLFIQKEDCEPTLFGGSQKNCDANAWQKEKDISWFSLRWIPVFFYLMIIGLTTFFSSLYTTFASLFSPLMMKFVLTDKSKYGFSDFLQDMIVTNKPLWFILFSLVLLSTTNTYLGNTYSAAAIFAMIVMYFKV